MGGASTRRCSSYSGRTAYRSRSIRRAQRSQSPSGRSERAAMIARGAGFRRPGVHSRFEANHRRLMSMNDDELFERGLAIRKSVLGAEYVEKSIEIGRASW